MTDDLTSTGPSLLEAVLERLRRHYRVEAVDLEAGRMQIVDGARTVRFELDPRLLSDYASTFDGRTFPEFSTWTEPERESARARRIVILIEECIESDLNGSLVGVALRRDPGEEPHLAEEFGAPTRSAFPDLAEHGSWHSDEAAPPD